jgi:hypothetical protein
MRSPQSLRSGSTPASPRTRAGRRLASAPPRRAAARLALVLLLVSPAAIGCGDDDGGDTGTSELNRDRFDSAAAFELIDRQVAFGIRPAGSETLRQLGDELRPQLPNGRFEAVPGGLRNVVGTIPGSAPAILIAAHYDTEYHPPGFVGANDAAAGTAAVVQLARTLERELKGTEHPEIRLVLFDGEEEPPGCPDIRFAECALRGSKAYAEAHADEIGAMILLDYVANEGLRIPRESNSDPQLWESLRAAAAQVGAEARFPDGVGGGVIDDHSPFLEAGVPAIDLIDFTYAYADTVEDTPDKLSEQELDAVGETVAQLVLDLVDAPPPAA